MHGTPLLSAKGNHDQDYNSGGSDYDEQHQAHQHNNAPPPPPQQQQQQPHQQQGPPPPPPGGNGKQTTGYNGQQPHQWEVKSSGPPPPPIASQQYPPPQPPPQIKPTQPTHGFQLPPQHHKGSMQGSDQRGDSKSLGEIGTYFRQDDCDYLQVPLNLRLLENYYIPPTSFPVSS